MDSTRHQTERGQPPAPSGQPGGIILRGLRSFVVIWAMIAVGSHSDAATGVSFNRDVRPILSEHCFACHGPDEKARKAGLRLDEESSAQAALRSGRRALVGGHPEESELMARILAEAEDDRMPPAETKKPLTPAKVAILRQWIEEGAAYEGHWAYLPPRRPEIPPVSDPSWPRNDLDRFVLARLDKEGLKPTPEAGKEKLLRRATLDLTGLPPTVEELDAFLADPEPKAYERVVDRLLASPHYGERMAQQWLDLARYGETQGYHHDRHRDMWHWRDWVIEAYNRNQPFDQFTIEQLAGDLLPHPTRDQLIATGFHRNEMTTSEGGALPEEYIVKYAVGRVDTTARVWLGTSMACAECHEHKFDPISQREYYEFFAFFYDTPENGLDREELNPIPRVTLETPEQRARAEQLDGEVAALEAAEQLAFKAPQSEWDTAQSRWEEVHRRESVDHWHPLTQVEARLLRTETLPVGHDGTLTLARRSSDKDVGGTLQWTLNTDLRELNGLRLEVIPDVDASLTKVGSESKASFFLSRIEVRARSRDAQREAAEAVAPAVGIWHRLGPFEAGSAKEALEREFGPEKGVDLRAEFDDGKRRWAEVAEATEGHLDKSEGGHRATFFTTTLTTASAGLVEIGMSGQDGLRLWLNGTLITSEMRTVRSEADGRVRLWLPQGENRLLLKVAHASGDRAFAFRVLPEVVSDAVIELAAAAANGHEGKHHPGGVLDEAPDSGWSAQLEPGRRAVMFVRSRQPFGFRAGTELEVRLQFTGKTPGESDVRLAVSGKASPTLEEFLALPDAVRAFLMGDATAATPEQRDGVRRYYREHHVPEARQARQLLAAKTKERDEFRRSWPTAMVMQAAQPRRETQIRVRGQYDALGAQVEPGVPSSILPWREGLPRNRLGLARWLMDPQHPLTARVVVNQYWQRYFGTGLVKTSEDFGAQGEWPSHPELLDWLATEFVRTGWDVKEMQRLIVTSATYRQDSVVRPDLMDRDPENRWLARGPRFRLEAENIRDLALQASGLLVPKVGGPSVLPYQPPGLWGQVSFEGTRDYVQSEGEGNYRRGLYTYWRRSIPYASFTIFDAPSREVCTVRRPRTNTPLQALALLNDPVYVEAARALAVRVLRHTAAGDEDRIRYAFRLVLGRLPTARETEILAAARSREFRRFAEDREDANRLIHTGTSAPPVDVDIAELAAWTVVANTLLNLDESITKG